MLVGWLRCYREGCGKTETENRVKEVKSLTKTERFVVFVRSASMNEWATYRVWPSLIKNDSFEIPRNFLPYCNSKVFENTELSTNQPLVCDDE